VNIVLPSIIGGAFGIAGVIVGFFAAQIVAWFERRKRHRSYWSALSAEVELCREHGDAYLNAHVASPAYRLPIMAYENGFPALLSDGAVTHDEARAVLAYYVQVDQMNRALDQAHDAREESRDELLSAEAKRLKLKARHVSAADKYYVVARKVIDNRLRMLGVAPEMSA
jgi:hypothetical protein